MKRSKTIIWSLIMLMVVAAIYRVIPGRPYGFAPQWAMAIFAGAVIRDRKFALLLPVLSMFFSDLFYQVLYSSGLSDIQGFYEGQWQNYLLFGLMTMVGFTIRKLQVVPIFLACLAAPTLYFILSNFVLWAGWSGTRGLGRPKTWEGLLLCYNDALPFYGTSILATLVFSTILFGTYHFASRSFLKTANA